MTTYTPRTQSGYMINPPQLKAVSLPSLPFDIPPAAADETKPATMPIMGTLTPEDKRWLRGIARIKA